MEIKYSKVHKYNIGYTNKQEFDILKDEIFKQEIYKLDLQTDSPIIFDLGSHIGLSILYFKFNYPNAQIIGFEPNPNIFPLLEENIYLNNLQDVELHNIALSDNNGVRDFYIDNQYDAFSTSGFTPNAWNGKQSTTSICVKTEKLSQYINSPIDLMKIDIEGAERGVLMELEDENKLRYIKNIIVESHGSNIVDILTRNGFEIEKKQDQDDNNLVYILGKNISYEPPERSLAKDSVQHLP